MPEEKSPTSSKKSFPVQWVVIGAIIVLGVVLFSQGVFSPSSPADSTLLTPAQNSDAISSDTGVSPNSGNVELSTTLSKSKFLKEIFAVKREDYDIYGQAAAFHGQTVDEVTAFFYSCCDLSSENDIFAELPTVPLDFPDVAYDLQIGNLYQIGTLGPEYYKQPEFYFNGAETGTANRNLAFRAWQNYDLQYWGDYGLQTYPDTQYDTLSLSNRKTFVSTVFVTNGWNIQNYVGTQLITTSADAQFFDIKISEDTTGQPYFLLSPTFPKFTKDWATKVLIEGTVKPNTPPGTYLITINAVAPPTELSQKWSSEHKGLYAPYGFLSPSGGYIQLQITVDP